ncbi:unnamed protein product, partial [Mesorhabditis spiculigera]
MCKAGRKTTARRESDPQEEEDGQLAGGSTTVACEHRSKKNLFDTKSCCKKLKNMCPIQCDSCARNKDKNPEAAQASPLPLTMCTACAEVMCPAHALDHQNAERTGECHVLAVILSSEFSVRCSRCDCDLHPEDATGRKDFVKQLLDQLANKQPAAAKASKTNGTSKQAPVAEAEEVHEDAESTSEVAVNGKSNKPDKKDKKDKKKAKEKEDTPEHLSVPKGLTNLGNTCYFNSVTQSIMFTYPMSFYYENFGAVKELVFTKQEIKVDDKSVEIEACDVKTSVNNRTMNDALKQLALDYVNARSGLTPTKLVSQIQSKGKIRVYQQQDSHELLRYLLDALRSEELDAYKKSIHEIVPLGDKGKGKSEDLELRRQHKAYLEAAGRPLLDSIFGGRLQQTIRCSKCGHISQQPESFLDLSLPVPSEHRAAGGKENKGKRNTKAKHTNGSDSSPMIDDQFNNMELDDHEISVGFTETLVECPEEFESGRNIGHYMRLFMAEETLDGVNKYECEKCCLPQNKKNGLTGANKHREVAIKRYLIWEPPTILTLHLKRFSQGFGGRGGLQKISGHIDFPEVFDIAPFCCKNVERVKPGGQRKILYAVYAIVCHSGTMHSGHYIAYVKSRARIPQAQLFIECARLRCADLQAKGKPEELQTMREKVEDALEQNANAERFDAPDGQWYYISDSTVSRVSRDKALGSEAYILFYERIH